MLDLSQLPAKKVMYPNGKHLLIDGDFIVHSSASSADGRTYIISKHKDTRGYGETFKYKKDAREWCVQNGVDEAQIQLEYHPEPVENALHNAKTQLAGIIKGCASDNYQIYVHGGGNFRHDIYPDYKAHRAEQRKPEHLEAVKDYLVNRWGAIKVEGMETDDKLGIQQMKGIRMAEDTLESSSTMIVSHDKDLDMIPGWHYKIKYGKPVDQGETYFIDELEGWKLFFTQCLTGDSTDGIPGLYKITGDKATRLKKFTIDKCENPQDMWEAVKIFWGQDYQEELMITANLLWIKRQEGEEDWIHLLT